MLKGLDLSGYDADPEQEEPEEVVRQKARIELESRLKENENRKVFMPLLPNSKSAVLIASNKKSKFKNEIELDEDTVHVAPKKKSKVIAPTSKLSNLKSKKSDITATRPKSSKQVATKKSSTKSESNSKRPKNETVSPKAASKKVKETITTKESLRAISMFG